MTDQTPMTDQDILDQAARILRARIESKGDVFSSPDLAKDYLKCGISSLGHEVFGCLWLDSRHRLIADERLFRGTISGASVHLREVVKSALSHNAAAVLVYHNHPSGDPTPSSADKRLTEKLVSACALIDCRVLDHLIVGGDQTVSFSELGLL